MLKGLGRDLVGPPSAPQAGEHAPLGKKPLWSRVPRSFWLSAPPSDQECGWKLEGVAAGRVCDREEDIQPRQEVVRELDLANALAARDKPGQQDSNGMVRYQTHLG